ncbi:MAG: SDR family NAD(P)-dependent oxidoreductase [Bacteroidetes bacterium]|nr:SDR family NAD(P)-dependent oxidoreductase [Bacteroidota bacterium]
MAKIEIFMDETFSRFGKWALIAGAAEGIGAAFSTVLAGVGMNLIMADINSRELNFIADELEKSYPIKTIRIHQDLSEKNAGQDCLDKVREIEIRLMVYVPAFSCVGKFSEYTSEEIDRFLSLNVKTPVHLVNSFLNRKPKDQPCGIILMSSLAGIVGPALVAPYAGTKSFTLTFSESLFHELKDEKVEILACCAGPTSTPTYWKSKPVNRNKFIDVMPPLDVAKYAIKMLGKKPSCIPGWKNRLSYFFLTRILPRRMAGRIVSNSMKKMYPDL